MYLDKILIIKNTYSFTLQTVIAMYNSVYHCFTQSLQWVIRFVNSMKTIHISCHRNVLLKERFSLIYLLSNGALQDTTISIALFASSIFVENTNDFCLYQELLGIITKKQQTCISWT